MKAHFRQASRLVLVDGEHRVLLFRHTGTDGKAFWAPPGGGLEDGETFEQAARREALEELGLTSVTVQRGWERMTDFTYVDHPVHQHEWYFVIQGVAPNVSGGVERIHEQEGILEMKWWTTNELESTSESVFPKGLASELRKIWSTQP